MAPTFTYLVGLNVVNALNKSDEPNPDPSGPPPPPSNVILTYNYTSNELSISWTSSADSFELDIFLGETKIGITRITTQKSFVFNNTQLQFGSFTASVIAKNSFGSSLPTTSSPLVIGVPNDPISLVLDFNYQTLVLLASWNTSDSKAVSYDYILKRLETEIVSDNVSLKTFSYGNNVQAGSYTFQVRTRNSFGTSQFVTSSPEVVQLIQPPSNVTVSWNFNQSKVILTWTNIPATGVTYYVQWKRNSTNEGNLFSSTSPTELLNIIPGDYSATVYSSKDDDSSNPVPSNAVTVQVPSAPLNFTALYSYDLDKILVTWTPGLRTVEYSIVYRFLDQFPGEPVITNLTSFSIETPPQGYYDFFIFAINALGNSAQITAPRMFVTEMIAPENITLTQSFLGDITFTWEPALDANFYNVVLYKSPNYDIIDEQKTTGPDTSFTFTNITDPGTYFGGVSSIYDQTRESFPGRSINNVVIGPFIDFLTYDAKDNILAATWINADLPSYLTTFSISSDPEFEPTPKFKITSNEMQMYNLTGIAEDDNYTFSIADASGPQILYTTAFTTPYGILYDDASGPYAESGPYFGYALTISFMPPIPQGAIDATCTWTNNDTFDEIVDNLRVGDSFSALQNQDPGVYYAKIRYTDSSGTIYEFKSNLSSVGPTDVPDDPEPAVLVYNQNDSTITADWNQTKSATSYTVYVYKDDLLDSEQTVYSNSAEIECDDNHRYFVEVTAFNIDVPNLGGPIRSANGIVSGQLFVNAIYVDERQTSNYLSAYVREAVSESIISVVTSDDNVAKLPKTISNSTTVNWSKLEILDEYSDIRLNFAFELQKDANIFAMNTFLPYTQTLVTNAGTIARIRYNFGTQAQNLSILLKDLSNDNEIPPDGITPETVGYTEAYINDPPEDFLVTVQFTDFYGTEHQYISLPES